MQENTKENEPLNYLSEETFNLLDSYLKKGEHNKSFATLEEIRLRTSKPIILKFNEGEKIFEEKTNTDEILETLQYICENSIYSYQNQICNGYITIRGGHRVGVARKLCNGEKQSNKHNRNFRIKL